VLSRPRFVALAAATLWTATVLGIVTSGVVRADMLGWDLGVFRDASRLLLSHQPLYDYAAQQREHLEAFGRLFAVHYPYANPPIFAIETIPLALVPQVVAYAIVTAAGLASLAWSSRRATGSFEGAGFALLAYPTFLGILAGQPVAVALGVFTATWALVEGGRPVTAGLVASLLAYKPPLLLVLPVAFLIAPRARRALAGLAAGGAAQVAISFAVAPKDTLAFPVAVRRISAYTETHFRDALSFTWRSFFALLAPHHRGVADALGALAVLACGAVAVVAMVRARDDFAKVFSVAVLATLACAWHCYPYDWVLLALPAWLLLPRVSVSPLAARMLVAALVAPWAFVWLVEEQRRLFGVALHPALPVLCAFALWLVRSAPTRQFGAGG
jgi:alpha-1,2-mannosyltransferase